MTFLYRHSLMLSLLASIGTLSTAFVSQYAFNLQPCVLCIYQRWPYAVVIVLSLAGMVFAKKLGDRLFQILIAAGFAITATFGGFHVGVEQGWWKGTDGCVADTSKSVSLSDLKDQIMSSPIAKCDEIAWELFGISMAGYNMVFAAMMMIFMLLAFSQKRHA